MKLDTNSASYKKWFRILRGAFIVVLTLFLFVFWWNTRSRTANADYNLYQQAIDASVIRFEGRMDVYIQALYAARGLFASSDTVTEEAWSRFVNTFDLSNRLPGMAAMAYINRVPYTELDSYSNAVRAGSITNPPETVNDGVSAFDRDDPDAFVVTYIEPKVAGAWEKTIGSNFASEENRREALELAAKENQPKATDRLISPDTNRAGFVLVLPVYDFDSATGTPEEKSAAITGAINMGFRGETLFSQAFSELLAEYPVEIMVFDGDEPRLDSLMYFSGENPDELPDPKNTSLRTAEIAGQTWTIAFISANTESFIFPAHIVRGLALLVTLFGLGWLFMWAYPKHIYPYLNKQH